MKDITKLLIAVALFVAVQFMMLRVKEMGHERAVMGCMGIDHGECY